MGYRIEKTVIFANEPAKNYSDYYMRDAEGNIMAIYRKKANNNNEYELRLKEQPIYGSSRLGVLNSDSLIAKTAIADLGLPTATAPAAAAAAAAAVATAAIITPNTNLFAGIIYQTASKTALLQNITTEAYYSTNRGYKNYELNNHLGNVLVTISDRKLPISITANKVEYYFADVVSVSDYYPFGMEMPGRNFNSINYMYGYQGQLKVDEVYGSGNLYSFDFRESDPRLGGQFWSIDPLANSYPGWSPYAFAQRRPIDGIELEGLEWKGTNDENNIPSGYMWDPDNARNTDETGNKTLKEGYYQQAIFFSENSTFNSDSKYNMGSSTATVFKAEGTTQTFDATTYPSDLDRYTTVPEGRYEATVGLHRSSYTALRMHDIGNTNSQIEMGSSTATGINIHKPGLNNLTGMTSDGIPCSAGCLLVDRDNWDTFIGLFDNDAQRSNPVGITVSRTYTQPVISKYTAPMIPLLNKSYFIQPDATRVYIPTYIDLKMKK